MIVWVYHLFLLKVVYLLLCVYLNWRWKSDKLLCRALVMMVITLMSVASHSVAVAQNHAYTILWGTDEIACFNNTYFVMLVHYSNDKQLHHGEAYMESNHWYKCWMRNNSFAGLWTMSWILTALPEDVALQIMDHLSPPDRVACSLVCKAWHHLATRCIRSICLKASNNTDVAEIEDWLGRALKGQQSSLQTLVWQCEECMCGCCRTTPFMDPKGRSPLFRESHSLSLQ